MSEYDLVCDKCKQDLDLDNGVVRWTTEGTREQGHMLVHTACAPESSTDGIELRLLTQPALFFGFVTDRFGQTIEDPEALKAVVWALVPFVSRPDNPTEMMVLRATTFGATFREKPLEIRRRLLPGHPR